MSAHREILTLQFGHYANHVGAHFWNVQELSFDYGGTKATDVDHDTLYREGCAQDGRITYTPRLLLADLKGALGSLSNDGGGLETVVQEAVQVDWPNVERREEPPLEKNEYLKFINNESTAALDDDFHFESKVKTWTDYLFPRFHARTVSVVNDYRHDDEKVQFDVYHMGLDVWKSEPFAEGFVDKIRRYTEECDNLQGFQIFADSFDGFGGLTSGCVQYLNDEYSNKSTFCLPLIPSHFADNDPHDQTQRDLSNLKDSTRLVNTMLLYDSLFEYTSMFAPICCGETGWRKPGRPRTFYNVNYDHKLNYHSSAVIASAIDTISFGYRHKNRQLALSDLCADMTGFGRKMAAASLGLPFNIRENVDLIDKLDADEPLFGSITPNCDISKEKLFQHIVVRGVPESKLKQTLKKADRQIKMAAYRCETVKEMFEYYFQCNYYASPTCVTTSGHGLEVKTPFPKVFSKDLNVEGFVKEFEDDRTDVESVPVIAGLHNGNFIFNTLESLLREGKRVKVKKMHKFFELGLEVDEYNECLDKIAEIQSNYDDNFEL